METPQTPGALHAGGSDGKRPSGVDGLRGGWIRIMRGCLVFWMVMLGAYQACAHGPSMDDHDWRVENRSGAAVLVTPISPVGRDGTHMVVCRRAFQERRFHVDDGAVEVINLETGDCRISGWVVETEGEPIKFVGVGDLREVVVGPLGGLRDATGAEVAPHLRDVPAMVRAAAWIVVPPAVLTWVGVAGSVLLGWMRRARQRRG